MSTVYYNPQEWGLTAVAEIDYSSGSYEFDLRVVWVNEEGALFTARDSGCSCPMPFEDYHSIEQLDRVDFRELESELEREDGFRTSSDKKSFLDAIYKYRRRECAGCGNMAVIPETDYLCGECRA